VRQKGGRRVSAHSEHVEPNPKCELCNLRCMVCNRRAERFGEVAGEHFFGLWHSCSEHEAEAVEVLLAEVHG
jgi:hypothetical protein